ncbi:MAG: VTT domain-containing protein [Candidatus Parcubacteria bacterium]|nr:VTT domain-containing protein [Candidatus Parcubacteria bacterium]
MDTVNLLTNLIENYQDLVYFFIFFGLIVEGEFILLATGILFHLGALNIYYTIFFIILGLSSKTFFGYYIGNILRTKWAHTRFLKYLEKRVMAVMPHFKRKPFWSIFISKFIIGVNNIVIIFAGYQKVIFKKYLKAEFCSTIIWAPALIWIGYFFSYAALHASREIWRFSVIVIVLTMLFMLFDRLIGWIYGIVEGLYDDTE